MFKISKTIIKQMQRDYKKDLKSIYNEIHLLTLKIHTNEKGSVSTIKKSVKYKIK